jgi:GPH family glycoside/pentoside/hexuronide:cation symporter
MDASPAAPTGNAALQRPDGYLGKLPLAVKAGWGVGAFGSLGMLWMVNVFVMFFLVNHVGMDPAVAGTILFITRLYDLVSDPLIGHLSDRTRSRWGRRRPWMFAGAIVSGLSAIGAFNVPAFESDTVTAAYELFVLLAYFTGFTLFYVPFMAMPAEMTDDYDERTSIMSFRVGYSSAGGIVLAAGMPAMISQLGSDRAAYEITSIVAAVLITASMLMTVAFTKRARELKQIERERHTVREYLRTLFRNRPFFTLAAIKFFVFLSAGINGSAGMFFMAHVIQRGEMGMAFLTFGSQVASLLTIPLWTKLSAGKDKRVFWMIAMFVNAAVTASWAFSSPVESDLVFGARAIIGGAMSSLGLLMGFSMLPDTIEYDRLTTDHDRAGMYTGLLGFIEKNAFAFGPLIIGFYFSAAGVVKGEVQSDAAMLAIISAKAWIPATVLFISAALLFTYRLDAQRLEELRTEHEGRVSGDEKLQPAKD